MTGDLTTPSSLPSAAELDGVAAACAFLSQLYLLPSAAVRVTTGMDPALVDDWPLPCDETTTAGLAEVRRALQEPDTHELLEADWRQLFAGPGPLAAPPWESVHRSEEGLTFQEQTIEVRTAYAAVGLRAPRPLQEPDDHVGLELAFVGELALAALAARENEDAQAEAFALDHARRFVADHVLTWVPDFGRLVTREAGTPMFRALGLLTTGTVAALGVVLRAPGVAPHAR